MLHCNKWTFTMISTAALILKKKNCTCSLVQIYSNQSAVIFIGHVKPVMHPLINLCDDSKAPPKMPLKHAKAASICTMPALALDTWSVTADTDTSSNVNTV